MAVTYASIDPATGNTLGIQRTLLAIYNDLQALTGTQQANVWADFTSGSPPRWATDSSPVAGSVMACSIPAIDLTGLAVTVQTKARMKMVAAYVVGNPLYLINPSFDPSINVPGYE